MSCQRCNSDRIISIGGKCSDLCVVSIGHLEREGYIPGDLGVGRGDYIEFEYCGDCGQIQGEFPLPLSEMESVKEE